MLEAPVNDEPRVERDRDQRLKEVQIVDILHGNDRQSREDD